MPGVGAALAPEEHLLARDGAQDRLDRPVNHAAAGVVAHPHLLDEREWPDPGRLRHTGRPQGASRRIVPQVAQPLLG